jgi:hypothetical protein
MSDVLRSACFASSDCAGQHHQSRHKLLDLVLCLSRTPAQHMPERAPQLSASRNNGRGGLRSPRQFYARIARKPLLLSRRAPQSGTSNRVHPATTTAITYRYNGRGGLRSPMPFSARITDTPLPLSRRAPQSGTSRVHSTRQCLVRRCSHQLQQTPFVTFNNPSGLHPRQCVQLQQSPLDIQLT